MGSVQNQGHAMPARVHDTSGPRVVEYVLLGECVLIVSIYFFVSTMIDDTLCRCSGFR
jgi:hypothetical protein